MGNCIYGIDSKSLSDEPSELREMGQAIFQLPIDVLTYFSLRDLFPFITKVYKMTMASKKVERFFDHLTRDAIQLRKDGNIQRDDFLNYLIQLRQKKNLEDIAVTAHAMTFFLDGYETSSMVIANIVNQMIHCPEVQKRLRKEITDVVAEGETITFEQIQEMEYLDQVFHGMLLMNIFRNGLKLYCILF